MSLIDVICAHERYEYEDILEHIEKIFDEVKPLTVLEIGTRSGNSARLFTTLAPKAEVYTVDVKDFGHKIDKQKYPNIKFIKSDTKDLAWTIPVDVLYIDGNHKYLDVFHDLVRFSFRTLHKVLIHDVTHPACGSEIRKAIDNFLNGYGCRFRLEVHKGKCGLGVLHVY